MTEITGHRLPRHVEPSAYRLHLLTDLDAASFSGMVDIDVSVLESTDTIVCNAARLDVTQVTVQSAAGTVAATCELDAERELAVVRLSSPIAVGEATVSFTFSGVLNSQLVGFYRSDFTVDGNQQSMAVTQFEAPYARWAFPCWDEPDFKATFEISLSCARGLTAVSNAPEVGRTDDGDLVRFDFAPTMSMSTYLVAWVIGELEVTEAVQAGSTLVRVLHRPGVSDLTAFALDCAAHAVAWFEEYYGIDYPGQKLDLIAVPDFAFGAMENLGCVTFRETLLLIDPERANRSEQERAATVIEHEIAHMWFGDLVTMTWWDGIWLNEAFATFMEISCADDYRPDWNIWTSFSLSRGQAFDTDSLASTRPIEFEVATPADAEAMFDILTYEKGASVLRMFEQWAGPEAFRDGVRIYLDRHAYGNTETIDLWQALAEASATDVASMMDTWIRQGGHPIVSASLQGTTLTLRQERYRYAGGDESPDASWIVPVRVHLEAGADSSTLTVLLDGPSATVELPTTPTWLSINSGATGFYRSEYDPTLRVALLDHLADLSTIDRYAFLDDSWALYLAGHLTLNDVAQTLRAIAVDERDPSVWRRVASIVSELNLVLDPADRPVLAAIAADLVGPHLDEPVGDDQDSRDRRAVIFRLAGSVAGIESVINDARTAFAGLPGSVAGDPDFETAVIDVASSHGDRETYERVLGLLADAETPQAELRALNGLARFRDPELIADFCERCATSVRTQNAPYSLAAAMGNPLFGDQVWRFVAERWDDLVTRFPSSSHGRMIGGIRAFADADLVAEIDAFLAEHPLTNVGLALPQHLERTRVNVETRRRASAELSALR